MTKIDFTTLYLYPMELHTYAQPGTLLTLTYRGVAYEVRVRKNFNLDMGRGNVYGYLELEGMSEEFEAIFDSHVVKGYPHTITFFAGKRQSHNFWTVGGGRSGMRVKMQMAAFHPSSASFTLS